MRRATVIGIAIAATAAVALGIGAVVWTSTRPPSASDVVLSYFSALAAGDADAALAETTIPSESADVTAAAYASVSERVADARIVSSSEDAGTGVVVVSYVLADQEYESAMELMTTTAEGWRIADAVAEVTATTTIGDAVGIGDLVLPTASPALLLPGRYDVVALPRGLVSGSTTVDIAPGSDSDVAVQASVAPEATAAAQAQLAAYATSCTQSAATVPENCGIRVPWAADLVMLTSIVYRIDAVPVLALSADGASFAATGGVLVATATGTSREGGTASFTYRADDWALRGTVSFQGEEMLLAVG